MSCPDRHATVPGFPDVRVWWRETSDDRIALDYSGWADRLVAAGIIFADMLEPTGKHRRDAEGDSISLARSWRIRGGVPQRYVTVSRVKPVAQTLALAGALEARSAFERSQALHGRPVTAVSGSRRLRLVVDNGVRV